MNYADAAMKGAKRNALQVGLLVLVAVVLAACTTTTVDEFRQGETGIESHESVVILGRRQGSSYETREEFVDCVGEIGRAHV